jgi:hypothetical protein
VIKCCEDAANADTTGVDFRMLDLKNGSFYLSAFGTFTNHELKFVDIQADPNNKPVLGQPDVLNYVVRLKKTVGYDNKGTESGSVFLDVVNSGLEPGVDIIQLNFPMPDGSYNDGSGGNEPVMRKKKRGLIADDSIK